MQSSEPILPRLRMSSPMVVSNPLDTPKFTFTPLAFITNNFFKLKSAFALTFFQRYYRTIVLPQTYTRDIPHLCSRSWVLPCSPPSLETLPLTLVVLSGSKIQSTPSPLWLWAPQFQVRLEWARLLTRSAQITGRMIRNLDTAVND